MKHIKTVNKPTMQKTLKTGGCGECQASCQSACKTSCTVGNQVCESRKQAGVKGCFAGTGVLAVMNCPTRTRDLAS